MLVHYHWLRHLWFLRGVEPACLVQVALKTDPRVFAPSEVPEIEKLYIIHKGCVLFGGRVLTSGKLWGEDIILCNPLNYTTKVARCMTYVEAYCITRSTLMNIIEDFPIAQKVVKRSALKVAFRWCMTRIREEAKRFQEEQDQLAAGILAADKSGASLLNHDFAFLDKVLEAALSDQRVGGISASGLPDSPTGSPADYRAVRELQAGMKQTNLAVSSMRDEMVTMRSDVSMIKQSVALLVGALPGAQRAGVVLPPLEGSTWAPEGATAPDPAGALYSSS